MNISKTSTFFIAIIIVFAMISINQTEARLADMPTSSITKAITEDIASKLANDFADDATNFIADSTVLVTVNDMTITYGEVRNALKITSMFNGLDADVAEKTYAQISSSELWQVKPMVRTLILNKLLLKEAEKYGITITDAEVEKQLEEELKASNSLKFLVTSQKLPVDVIKKVIKEGYLIGKKLANEITKDIKTTDEEVLAYYNEKNKDNFFYSPEMVKASHILVPVKEEATPEAKAEAKAKCEALLAQLKAGTDFATLLEENSNNSSDIDGGDLGFFTRGQLAPEFDAVAFTLEKGAISDVVETKFGYHIIKVTDKRKEGIRTFEEKKEELRKPLQGKKEYQKVQEFITKLNESAIIEYTDAYKNLTTKKDNEIENPSTSIDSTEPTPSKSN